MPGSKIVVLVPDVTTRDRIRSLACTQAIYDLQTSVYVAHDLVDVCVRDTRRALFDGPLAVLTRDEPSALRALSAGADEAFALSSFELNGPSWSRLVDRAQLKAELRHESAQRLASLSELEKLCALGRLVSAVAEELSDPLSSALISLELLKLELEPLYAGMARVRELCEAGHSVDASELRALVAPLRGSAGTPARARAVLGEVTETCEAIAQVARDLGLDAHAPERYEYVDLRAMLEKILRLFRRAIRKTTHIERDYSDELPEVLAPRARVAQVLISLLANALTSLRAVERDVHRLRICLRADETVVTVTVSDTGAGLACDVLERVFDPFAQRAQDALEGRPSSSGLELAVARSAMRSLGGDLLVESLRGEGATFVAWLPRPKQRETRTASHEAKRAEARHSVLVLEPDGQVLSALSQLLGERYEVLLAASAREARQLLARGRKPDAILAASDDADGREFVEWLLFERPELTRRLLLTTDADEPADGVGQRGELPSLARPLEPAALFRSIEERLSPPLRKVRAPDSESSRAVARW